MSASTETSPLLESGGHHSDNSQPFASRASSFFKGEGEPSWAESFKFFIFGTWFNILLVFIPLSFMSHYLNWDAGLRFLFSFVAIVPLAKVRASLLSSDTSMGAHCHCCPLSLVTGRGNRTNVRQIRRHHVWSP